MRRVQERPSPPPASRPSLEAVVTTMLLDAAAVEVTSALRRRGVPSRLLKGAAIASWLYGDGGRSYVDVDLLVPSSDLDAAEEVMRSLGFEPAEGEAPRVDRPRHARVWERAADAAVVDVHTTLAGIGVDAQQAWEVLTAESDEIAVGGVPVTTLDVSGRALHVVLHAAQHGARSPQALADLEAALARLPLETWRRCETLARGLDAVPAFVAGLDRVPAGQGLVAKLELPSARTVEAELRAIVKREETLGSALAFEWLAGARGAKERAAFVGAKVVPARSSLRRRSSLARRGTAGLVAAYVLRLGRLAPHAVSGFIAWRRARKAAR
jgi:hypothetical protein